MKPIARFLMPPANPNNPIWIDQPFLRNGVRWMRINSIRLPTNFQISISAILMKTCRINFPSSAPAEDIWPSSISSNQIWPRKQSIRRVSISKELSPIWSTTRKNMTGCKDHTLNLIPPILKVIPAEMEMT